jgi:hypothetical protein
VLGRDPCSAEINEPSEYDVSNTLGIRCRCGQLRGLLTSTNPSNRCVCYCADCQAFARHLQAQEALDSQGGTAIVQVPPSNLKFTRGAANLGCLRLTDSGLLRWYSTCCKTPIGNTPANWRVSIVGLIHTCLEGDNQAMDASFGPVTMRVGVRSAIGSNKPRTAGLVSGVAKAMAMIVGARVTGAYRDNALFDQATGVPVALPTVLSAAELIAAKRLA